MRLEEGWKCVSTETVLHYTALCQISVLFQGHQLVIHWHFSLCTFSSSFSRHIFPHTQTVTSLFNHHFILRTSVLSVCGRVLLRCTDLFSVTHKAHSFLNQSPHCLCKVVATATLLLLSHIWNKEEERWGLQHYACDMLWELWENEKEGGRKRMWVYVCSQNLPPNPRTEKQIPDSFATPTLEVSAASCQNTECLVVLSASRPKHWKNCCLFHHWRQ